MVCSWKLNFFCIVATTKVQHRKQVPILSQILCEHHFSQQMKALEILTSEIIWFQFQYFSIIEWVFFKTNYHKPLPMAPGGTLQTALLSQPSLATTCHIWHPLTSWAAYSNKQKPFTHLILLGCSKVKLTFFNTSKTPTLIAGNKKNPCYAFTHFEQGSEQTLLYMCLHFQCLWPDQHLHFSPDVPNQPSSHHIPQAWMATPLPAKRLNLFSSSCPSPAGIH